MSRRHLVLLVAAAAIVAAAWLFLRAKGNAPGRNLKDPIDHTDTLAPGAARNAKSNAAPLPSASAGYAWQWTKTWGSGPDQFGRDRPTEGNPEGPKSLAMGPNQSLYVLDQVNHRISLFDKTGKPLRQIPVPVLVAEDLAVASDGSMAVLDRVRDQTVALVRPDGTLAGKLPLEGKGIPEGGGVTAIHIDGKDVYAERESGPWILLGKTDGTAAEERTQLPGRPSRNGQFYVSAAVADRGTGLMYIAAINRPGLDHRFTRYLRAPAPGPSLVFLDTDQKGVIYLAVQVQHGPQAEDTIIQLLCFEPSQGNTLGTTTLPASSLPEETFRDFEVLEDGGVLYSYKTDNGVEMRHYTCP